MIQVLMYVIGESEGRNLQKCFFDCFYFFSVVGSEDKERSLRNLEKKGKVQNGQVVGSESDQIWEIYCDCQVD